MKLPKLTSLLESYIGSNDDEYLKLAKDPEANEERLQELVEAAAKSKGYNIEAYHGTNAKSFDSFNTKGLAAHFGTKDAASDRNKHLKDFSMNVVGRSHSEPTTLTLYLKIDNTLDMPDLAGQYQTENGSIIDGDEVDDRIDEFYHEDEDNPEQPYPMSWEDDSNFSEWLYVNDIITVDQFWDVQYSKDGAVELLKADGYDGIAYTNEVESKGSTSYIVFDPNQIKSADPVTYDKSGSIIPLSKRFDSSTSNINY